MRHVDHHAARIRRLLAELCSELGFCLPIEDQARLADQPPDSIDSFTDAVLVAEGLNLSLADKSIRSQVRNRVAAYFTGG